MGLMLALAKAADFALGKRRLNSQLRAYGKVRNRLRDTRWDRIPVRTAAATVEVFDTALGRTWKRRAFRALLFSGAFTTFFYLLAAAKREPDLQD